MSEQTCEGCGFYECYNSGYPANYVEHRCMADPAPVVRKKGERKYGAPRACRLHPVMRVQASDHQGA